MKPISTAMDHLFQPKKLADDEYLNEVDGLIYTFLQTVFFTLTLLRMG